MLGNPEVMRFYPEVKDRKGTLEWMSRIFEHHLKGQSYFWSVVLKESKEIVGQVGLVNHQIPGIPEFEVAYMMKRRFWKQGFARESAIRVRDFAFTELELPRIVSLIHPLNEASIQVALALGMSRLGNYLVDPFGQTKLIYRTDNPHTGPKISSDLAT
jgi:[ribosomal protein S5]-alanine N-acetyltransferase